jgi:hypothetical protein
MAKPNKKLRYPRLSRGVWYRPPKLPRTFHMECCDCGLIHTFWFRVRKDQVEFKACRNVQETKRIRKMRRIVVR